MLEAPNKAEVTLRWTVILLDASLIRNRSSEQQKTPFPQDCNDYSDSCFQWNWFTFIQLKIYFNYNVIVIRVLHTKRKILLFPICEAYIFEAMGLINEAMTLLWSNPQLIFFFACLICRYSGRLTRNHSLYPGPASRWEKLIQTSLPSERWRFPASHVAKTKWGP